MPLVIQIGGGVALLLFAIRFLRKGLDRLFGPSLGRWLAQLSTNRCRAFGVGVGLAVIAPSSTTMSILAVQSTLAGQLSSRQGLAVMLGADIGMTAMVFLVALQLDALAPALLLIGIILFQFTQRNTARGVGQVLTAFGLLFLGIGIIRTGASAVAGEEDIHTLLKLVRDHPLPMALVSTALAVLMQSGTATIFLVMALAADGRLTIPPQVALAAVAGANVGIAVTTLVVGWRGVEARRLALGNLIAKASLATVVLMILPFGADLLASWPYSFELLVASAHTAFNVALALIFLPLLGPLHRLTILLAPKPNPSEPAKFGPRHITSAAPYGLAVSLGQSAREILHASEIVRAMLEDAWRAIDTNDPFLARAAAQRDDEVDLLDAEIKRFLTRAINEELDEHAAGEQMRQLRYLNDLETIGDIVDKNLCELVLKKIKLRVSFSTDGWSELNDFYRKVVENMLIADTAFTTRDELLAKQLLRHKDELTRLERELRDRHFTRLKSGLAESHETSAIHLDLLTHLKRINSTVSHVAYPIVQKTG